MAAGAVVCNLTNALPKRCAVFDGVDDYIDVNNIEIHNRENYSISMWVNGNLQSDTRIYMEGSGSDDSPFFSVGIESGGTQNNIKVYVRDDDNVVQLNDQTTTRVVLDNTWHHVIFIDSNGDYVLYVDGVVDVSGSYTKNTKTLDKSTIGAVGRASYSNYFNGSIADVKIFNKALSQAEVTKVYAGSPVTDGLIHRYKLYKDYKDSVGSNDGTNSGTYLTTVDDKVSTAISDARTTANDKYLMAIVNNKIMTSVIEEAP